MKTPPFPDKSLTALLLLALLTFACDSKRTTSDEGDSARPVSLSPEMGATQVATTQFFLDSLVVSDSVFKANRNKNFAFQFYMDDTTVTLHGWVRINNNSGFDTPPDVKLTPQGKTGISIGPGSTIGNQALLKDPEKAIVDYIAANKPSNSKANLKFMPVIDTPGRIKYKITIEFLEAGKPIKMFTHPSFETNPSPPRKAFD